MENKSFLWFLFFLKSYMYYYVLGVFWVIFWCFECFYEIQFHFLYMNIFINRFSFFENIEKIVTFEYFFLLIWSKIPPPSPSPSPASAKVSCQGATKLEKQMFLMIFYDFYEKQKPKNILPGGLKRGSQLKSIKKYKN